MRQALYKACALASKARHVETLHFLARNNPDNVYSRIRIKVRFGPIAAFFSARGVSPDIPARGTQQRIFDIPVGAAPGRAMGMDT